MIAALRRIAGEGAVTLPDDGRWRVHGHAPQAVVSPSSPDAVAAVLALCSAEGWRVEPAGAGTWLDHGRAPSTAPDIVLSTRQLATRIDTEPADLVAGADAGVALHTLQQRLADNHQELPLDPPGATRAATLGALAALASAGPLRASTGTPRDHLLGVTVATGDGQLLRFGGRVVKNVAGYDVVRLLTGSRGTLGVITSVWLRLRAKPSADRTWLVSGALAELLQVIAGLRDVRPAAAELLAPATADALDAGTGWRLAIRLRGGMEEVDDASRRLRGLVGGLTLTAAPQEFWVDLGALEAAARPLVRVAGRAASLAGTLELCKTCIAASGNDLSGWHLAAHATGGIVRLWPVVEPMDEELRRLASALADLRLAAESAGGSMLLDAAAASLQERVPIRGAVDAVTARLEAELKRVMDPAGILAPERWA